MNISNPTRNTEHSLARCIELTRTAVRDNQLEQARALLVSGLQQHPADADLRIELGRLCLAQRQWPQAEAHLRQALNARPDDASLHVDLADIYSRRGDWPHAAASYRKAVTLAPDLVRAALGLVNALHPLGHDTEALAALDALLAIRPGEDAVLRAKIDLLTTLGRHHDALAVAEPEIGKAELNLGKAELNLGMFDRWCELLRQLERGAELADRLEGIVALYPLVPELWSALGRAKGLIGAVDRSVAAYTRANELRPGHARNLFDLGAAELFRGHIEDSHRWIGQSLAIDPQNAMALRLFGMEHRYMYGDEAFVRLNIAATEMSDKPLSDRMQLHYALGKAFDDVGEYASAFAHYAAGGSLHRREQPFDEASSIRLTEALTRNLNAETPTLVTEPGYQSDKPVFVLGMPRSGTSLVEQVLASHRQVYGAGEQKLLSRALQGIVIGKSRFDINETGFWPLNERVQMAERGRRYVEALERVADSGAIRIVDKMPANAMFVGCIPLILPNARIIHTRRHPVETCLSCYRIMFVDGQEWSYDLRELGRYFRRYNALMRHWREQFPGLMLEVRYEDVVSDFEGQARRITEYLGLAWDDACLKFHETERPVRTASASQVRKPIYATSTNRWRKYEKYLGPLLEELGDIVPEYEAEIAHLAAKP
jgi:tetratricopeptide (TPR) repeat protein